jgi:hypothetical protein
MIFVVEYEKNGDRYIDIVHKSELDTDPYEKINKIFFCENATEVKEVTRALNQEIQNGYE